MKILLNGEPIELDNPTTLRELLEKRSLLEKKGIAIAVNQEVVQRTEWEACNLKQDDAVLVIQATQGG